MSNVLNQLKNQGFLKCSGFNFIGNVTKVVGSTIEVEGIRASLGARCVIESSRSVLADVIGFKDGRTILQPLESAHGVTPSANVRLIQTTASIKITDEMIGRVIDPLGNVVMGEDIKNNLPKVEKPIANTPLPVANRDVISEPFDTGIKAINAMFPIGFGQRVGLFAGTGVGKSVLQSMITKFSEADVVVIGLVGERGREVYEFYHETLDDEARTKSIIVSAPADQSAILRLQCPEVATSIAEYYRDRGMKVLLLIDSLTRYAQAQRDVGLASGEPPVTKGYPPSAFSKLPALVERAGKVKGGASITAFYTVLTEGDDMNDPIADAARGVLDGHIVLSRELASRGLYPALDVPSSISRLADKLLAPSQFKLVNELKSYYSTLKDNAELISIGLIEKGKNKKLDQAIRHEKHLYGMIAQGIAESFNIKESSQKLFELSLKLKDLKRG